MAASINSRSISTLVCTRVRIKTVEAVYTGTVGKSSDDSRVILEDVAAIDLSSNDRLELPMTIIFANEILDFQCLSLPQPSRPERRRPVTPPATSDVRPIANLGASHNGHQRQPRRLRESETTVTRMREPSPSLSPSPSHSLSVSVPGSHKSDSPLPPPPAAAPSLDEYHPRRSQDVPLAVTSNGAIATDAPNESLADNCIPFDDPEGMPISTKRPNLYAIVDRLGATFDEAISLIEAQAIVGVHFDGIKLDRHGQLCWIEISTKDLVILFDICSLSRTDHIFDNGFREIFESATILKVIHDCRRVSDILNYQFKTRLTNVYDTQVADIMAYRIRKKGLLPNYVRPLDELLIAYLQMTKAQVAFHQIQKVSLEREPETWRNRPQEAMFCQLAALNVRYLRELRVATLEGILVDFNYGVGLYLDVRDFDTSNGRILIQNDVNLPKEFLVFGRPNPNGTRCVQTVGELLESVTLGTSIISPPSPSQRRRTGANQKQGHPSINGYRGECSTSGDPLENFVDNQNEAKQNLPKVVTYPAGMNWRMAKTEMTRNEGSAPSIGNICGDKNDSIGRGRPKRN